MATTIQWGEKYSVKIREIDNQHKKLIGMLNELSDAMSQGKGNDVLGRVLKGLVDYTLVHFKYEEQLMKDNGYEDFAAHKAAHDDLAKQASELYEQFKGGKALMSIKVLSFLSNWLNTHILNIDMKYSPVLVEKGVR